MIELRHELKFYLLFQGIVQGGERFVEKEGPVSAGHDPRQGEPLFLTAGELTGPLVFNGLKSELAQEFGDRLLRRV